MIPTAKLAEAFLEGREGSDVIAAELLASISNVGSSSIAPEHEDSSGVAGGNGVPMSVPVLARVSVGDVGGVPTVVPVPVSASVPASVVVVAEDDAPSVAVAEVGEEEVDDSLVVPELQVCRVIMSLYTAV